MSDIDVDALVSDALGLQPRTKRQKVDVDALVRQVFEETEPGFLDYAQAVPESLAAGAVQGVGAGISGLGVYTGSDALKSAGRSVSQAAPEVDPRLAGDLGFQTIRGLGSSVPTLAAGGAVALATGGNPYAVAGTVGAGSVLMEAGATAEEARARPGVTDEEADAAGRLGGLGGLFDILPEAGAVLRTVRGAARGVAIVDTAAKPLGGVERVLRATEKLPAPAAIGVTGLGEAVQETAQGKWSEFSQRVAGAIDSEDDARSVWDVAQHEGLPGGLAGAIMEGVTRWLTRGRVKAGGPASQPVSSGLTTPSLTQPEQAGAGPDVGAGAQTTPPDTILRDSGESPAPAPLQPIELPDEGTRAAVERFVNQPAVRRVEKGKPGKAPDVEIQEAPEALGRHAGSIGARVVMLRALDGEALPAAGAFDRETGTILIDATRSTEEQQAAVLEHELVHFAGENHPEVAEAYAAAIEAVLPGYLRKRAGQREGRQRAVTPGAPGPVLSPEGAQEEAAAEIIQEIPSFLAFADAEPGAALRLATYRPGVVRAIADLLVDLAHKLGIAAQPSVRAQIRDLHSWLALNGTDLERGLGATKGAQLALKVRELERSMRGAVPVEQPRANRATRENEAEFPVPDLEAARQFPRPEPGSPAAIGMERQLADVRSDVARTRESLARHEGATTGPAAKRAKKLRQRLAEQERLVRVLDTKKVGDRVRVPGGLEGTVLEVRGPVADVRVERPIPASELSEDVTLGVPPAKLQRVTARRTFTLREIERILPPEQKAAAVSQEKTAAARQEPKQEKPKSKGNLPVREVEVKEEPEPKMVPASPEAKRAAARAKRAVTPRLTDDTEGRFGKLTYTPRFALAENEAVPDVPFALAPQTDTPAFKAWFRDSKVVDADGKPLVVYHGTGAAFSAFDSSRARKNSGHRTADLGLFFTASPRIAASFAPWKNAQDWPPRVEFGTGANIIPVYLSIKKPLDVSAEEFIDRFVLGDEDPHVLFAESGADFDGVLIRKAVTEDNMRAEEFQADTWVAFEPEQAKSATGNRGTFDPSNPDIRFALPVRRKLPAMTKHRIEEVVGRFGADNKDQTARTSEKRNVRAFQGGVRSVRQEGVEVAPRAEAYAQADAEIKKDASGLRDRLMEKYRARGDFESWEQVALSKLADRAAQKSFRTVTREDIAEATRLRWVFEDIRRLTAQRLGVIRDAFKEWGSGPEALSSVIAVGTRATRAKLAKIREALDGTLSDKQRLALQEDMDRLAEEEAKTTQKVLAALRKAGLDPELVTLDYFHDPVAFSRAARIASTVKAGWRDWFLEWRIAAMLGGPLTHIANVTGNATMLGYDQVLGRVAEAMVNTVARNPSAAQLSELGPYFRAWVPGLAQAGHNFLLALRTELPAYETELRARGIPIPRLTTKADALEAGRQAIPGPIGRILRAPSTTLLLAADEFFKTLTGHTQATALAYRQAKSEGLTDAALARRMGELMTDPTSPIHLEAWQTAKHITFQDVEGSKILPMILNARSKIDEAFHFPVGSMLLPFVTTPYRIFQRGLSIPFSPAVAAHHWITGKWKEQDGLREHDIAETVLGLAVSLALVYALSGDDDDDAMPRITGSSPANYGERLLADRTAPPQSIRVNGTYYSFARVEPLSVAFSTIIDLANAVKAHEKQGKGAQAEAALARLAGSFVAQAGDKTWLRTVGDVYKIVTEPETGRSARFVRDTLVTPMIPNTIRAGARASDDYLRGNTVRKYDDSTVWESAMRSVGYEALPLASRAPPIKYDLWGRPALRNARSYGERLFSPTPERAAVADVSSLDIMLARYRDRIEAGDFPDEKAYFPTPPSYDYTDDGQTHYWSDEDYARLSEESGKMAAATLLQSKVLRYAEPTPKDIEAVRKALATARRTVKDRILRERKVGAER